MLPGRVAHGQIDQMGRGPWYDQAQRAQNTSWIEQVAGAGSRRLHSPAVDSSSTRTWHGRGGRSEKQGNNSPKGNVRSQGPGWAVAAKASWGTWVPSPGCLSQSGRQGASHRTATARRRQTAGYWGPRLWLFGASAHICIHTPQLAPASSGLPP